MKNPYLFRIYNSFKTRTKINFVSKIIYRRNTVVKIFIYSSVNGCVMSDQTDNKQPTPVGMRVKLALVSLMSMLALIGVVAADLNSSVGPLLDSLIALFVPILALIVAAVPIIITMAIIGFIVGLLAGILAKLKM